MSEVKNENKLNVAGTIAYVEKVENKFSAKLVLDYTECEKLSKASKKWFPHLPPFTARYDEEKKEYSINIKSYYDFPMINADSTKFTDELYAGAEVVVKLVLRDYKYKTNKGVTTYLTAMMIKKNGEYRPLSAEDFTLDLNSDDMPF